MNSTMLKIADFGYVSVLHDYSYILIKRIPCFPERLAAKKFVDKGTAENYVEGKSGD